VHFCINPEVMARYGVFLGVEQRRTNPLAIDPLPQMNLRLLQTLRAAKPFL
jgi:hypothetical protein